MSQLLVATVTFLDSSNIIKQEENTDSTLRFASHKDKNFTTLVVQHDVGGLEVNTKEGDWINIECAPPQFLFMACGSHELFIFNITKYYYVSQTT